MINKGDAGSCLRFPDESEMSFIEQCAFSALVAATLEVLETWQQIRIKVIYTFASLCEAMQIPVTMPRTVCAAGTLQLGIIGWFVRYSSTSCT